MAAEHRIQLGPDITGDLGTGAPPEVGKGAMEETVSDLEKALKGVNMCFIATGMGGSTGTGAASVIAEAARRTLSASWRSCLNAPHARRRKRDRETAEACQ